MCHLCTRAAMLLVATAFEIAVKERTAALARGEADPFADILHGQPVHLVLTEIAAGMRSAAPTKDGVPSDNGADVMMAQLDKLTTEALKFTGKFTSEMQRGLHAFEQVIGVELAVRKIDGDPEVGNVVSVVEVDPKTGIPLDASSTGKGTSPSSPFVH